MILPLGDRPNPPGTPIITRLLIGLNVAVFLLVTVPLGGQPPDPSSPLLREYLAMLAELMPGSDPARLLAQISAYDLVTFRWGYRPAVGDPLTLISSMFLHGGLLHLAGNMLFLWIYGDNVEHRLGRVRYLLAYLAAGVAATLFHALFDLGSLRPLVGASGAISGVLGFYFVWFPRNQVRLLIAFFPFLMDVIMVPARLVLGMYLLLDNLLPLLFAGGAGGGVAHGAHIGGFLAGLGGAALLTWMGIGRAGGGAPAPGEPAPAAPSATGAPGVLSGLRRAPDPERAASEMQAALARGDHEQVARLWLGLGRLAPEIVSTSLALDLAERLGQQDRAERAVELAEGVLAFERVGPRAARAHLLLGDLRLTALGQPDVAGRHYAAAMAASSAPEVAARARVGLSKAAEARRRIVQPRRPRGW